VFRGQERYEDWAGDCFYLGLTTSRLVDAEVRVDSSTRSAVARELYDAYATRRPVDQISTRYPDMTVEDSYQIQLAQIAERLAAGRVVIGHKVGLTSMAMQRQLGVDQPDYGHITDDMIYLEHAVISRDAFLQPKVEPEIAFVLKRPLRGPGVTVAQAIAAIDFVLPAVEIIDSRIRDWKIGILDTIADNASSGGIVLGSTPVQVDAVDLRLSGCVLHRNGEVAATGAGGAVLGSPLTSLVWLANTVGPLGITLEEGHIVLPGSQTSAIAVTPGDTFTAQFAGIGSVTTRFAA
jgi:2-keto-4-pentenoate hydratase